MNRRAFLRTCAAAAIALANPSFSSANPGERQLETIGVELYTVRGQVERDMEGTLAKIAGIGYREVEFAGYFDHPPKDIRAMLDRHGIRAPSAHTSLEMIDNHLPEVIEVAQLIGHTYIVCSSIGEEQQDLNTFKHGIDVLNRASDFIRRHGMILAYHNHDFEFRSYPFLGGKSFYDVLLAETDAKQVKMQMDLCWITVGGQDPLAYFERFPGRFPMVHVKDVLEDNRTQVDVGKGRIDWKRIFAHSEQAGIRHYFVEHDEPLDPMKTIRESYRYLRGLRF